jgi:hypothetical protein
MIARLGQIAPRLKKLLLMLSSSHDGEVVAAARKIDSALRDSGNDWHALADALTELPRAYRPPPRDHDRHADGDWRAMRALCLQHTRLLRAREYEFLIDLGHWRGDLTQKQFAWLSLIHMRVRRGAG